MIGYLVDIVFGCQQNLRKVEKFTTKCFSQSLKLRKQKYLRNQTYYLGKNKKEEHEQSRTSEEHLFQRYNEKNYLFYF